MKLRVGSTIKWPSKHNEGHWFTGTIKGVFYKPEDTLHVDGIAAVDDGLGLTLRNVPTRCIVVTNDPTRIALKHK